MTKNKENEGEVVDLTKKVKVYPTSSAPYHKAEAEAGAAIECSQLVADKMLANGWASLTPQKESVKTSKKDKDLLG